MPVKRRASVQGGDRYSELLKALGKVRLEGRSVIELFTEIPDANMYPDYRDIVETPISLQEIRKRVRVGAYENDDSFISDFELMADNARAYNGDESPVFDDATDILDFVRLYCGREISKSSREKLQLLILNELESYKLKGRKLSDVFMVEPDINTYPTYLDVVKNPTSFSKVRHQLASNGPCDNWKGFRDLVSEIFTNAMAYNQEGSPIYNDAKALLKQLDSKIAKHSQIPKHLGAALPAPPRSGEASNGASASVSDDDDDAEEDDAMDDGDDGDDDDGDDDDDDDPEVVAAPRFDDDDDEDFEADSEDMDDEDLVEGGNDGDNHDPSGHGVGSLPSQFMQSVPVYDEIVYRPPDEGVADALLQMVTCHSTPIPPHIAVSLPIEDVKRAENDIFQLRIPPSPSKAFATYAFTLPYYQSTLRLSVTPNHDVQPLQVTVLMNGAKLSPLPAVSVVQQLENYELTLAPGLNQVTVVAIKSTYGGYMRQLGPPPLADAEPDEERIVLFLNLSK